MKLKHLLLILLLSSTVYAQTGNKILFDARRAQMAGNADWVVDADLFNIGTGTGGIMQTGKGNEANPQRYPTPAQSGITATTAESYWKGALSAWAVTMVKRGFIIETLTNTGTLTYGNTSNAQDLSNYKIFISVEPNIKFTAAEKTALLNFVSNGGGLFMGGNHNGSDRNNDGWDAPHIWNDFMNSNGTITNPFGITFDYVSFSQTTSNFATISGNTILNGSAGTPLQMKYSSGTSMTLNKTINPNALGLVFKTGASKTGSTNVLFAQSRYGSGKIAAIGDSSPIDDGTGDNNDQLYNGWSAEVNGDHAKILTNATLWLASTTPRLGDEESIATTLTLWPNPTDGNFQINFNSIETGDAVIQIYDMNGRCIYSAIEMAFEGSNTFTIQQPDSENGVYLIRVLTGNENYFSRFMKN